MITQTKSRSRHCNDNALVEGKNAVTVRKHMGRVYISQKYAPRINKFYEKHLNPFVNFHKPCAFSSEIVDSKGKIKKIYKQCDYATPIQKLLSLKDCEKYLKAGITKEKLEKQMLEKSHFEVARETYEARDKLFGEIESQK